MTTTTSTIDPIPASPNKGKRRKQGYWRLVARQFVRNRKAVVALAILIVLGIVALTAPCISEEKPIYLVKNGQRYWFPNMVTYPDLVDMDFQTWTPGPADYAI